MKSMIREQGATDAERNPFGRSGKIVLSLVDGYGLRLVGEGHLGPKPRGKEQDGEIGEMQSFPASWCRAQYGHSENGGWRDM